MKLKRKSRLIILIWFGCMFNLQTSDAQNIKKIFFDSDGNILADPTKAASYALMERTEVAGWHVMQYNTGGRILTDGHYRDEALTIPEGEFLYYRYFEGFTHMQYNYAKHKIDTMVMPEANYVEFRGSYINGKRNGKWEEYFRDNSLHFVNTYKDDVLEGPYQSYNMSTGTVLIEGNMAKGIRVGEWNLIGRNGEITSTDIYKNGKMIKTINHLPKQPYKQVVDFKINYDFTSYLNKSLASYKFKRDGRYEVRYLLKISEDGRFHAMNASSPSALQIDTAILNVIENAPAVKPATENGKPVTSTLTLVMTFKVEQGQIEFIHKHDPKEFEDRTFYLEYMSMYHNQTN